MTCVFKTLHLFFLPNLPGPTFIPCPTSILEARVHNMNGQSTWFLHFVLPCLYRWRLELMPLTPNHQKNAFLQYPCSDIEVEKSLKKQLEKCHLLAQSTCEYSEPTIVVDRGPKIWQNLGFLQMTRAQIF